VVGIFDVINCVNFGEDPLRGLGVAGVKVCLSPLTLIVVLCGTFVWAGNVGAVINLAIVTVERYLMAVHSVWSKKKLRD